MQAEPVIVAEELTRRFGEKTAVDRLSLTVGAGEVFGFLGHNGSGKTTTVRLLNGVLTPSAGRARVLGLSPATDGPALRRRAGVLTETPSLEERLTARDNLRIFADLFGVPKDEVENRIKELLLTFDLSDRADEKVGGYSRGMKQRLALARALLHNPEIIFLDEPTSGLDPVATRRVHDLIRHLSREEGRTVFLCTHNLVEAQQLCDRVAVLEHGRVVALGTSAELARQWGGVQRLEIEVEQGDQERAAALLRAVPGVRNVERQNGTLLVKGGSRETVPLMLAELVRASVPVYRAAPHEASLEDVYFALHGEREGRQ